jgi:hypothetical protein
MGSPEEGSKFRPLAGVTWGIPWRAFAEGVTGGGTVEGVHWLSSPGEGPVEGYPSRGFLIWLPLAGFSWRSF